MYVFIATCQANTFNTHNKQYINRAVNQHKATCFFDCLSIFICA